MENSLNKNRFHVIYSAHFLRRLFLLCLLPLVRALFLWSLPALFTALRQDALLLAVLAAASTLMWRGAWWQWQNGCLLVHGGILLHRTRQLPADRLACVSVEEPPLYRLLGAAQLRLYFTDSASVVTLYLTHRTAYRLAEALLPTPPNQREYRPRGYDRLGLVAVSANLLTTLALVFMGIHSWPDRQNLETAALRGLDLAGALLARWLGTGLSLALAAAALLWTGALLVAASRTAFYRVHYGGGVLRTSSGLFTHVDRSLRQDAITACTIHAGPAARVFRRFPVHVQAGGYLGEDLPVFLYSPTSPDDLEEFLPGCRLTPAGRVDLKDRSLPVHLLLPGLCCLLSLILLSVSTWQLPDVTPPLAALFLYFAALLFCGVEGFLTECVRREPGGPPVVRYTRNFTHYTAVLLSPRAGYFLYQSPFAAAVERCNVYFTLPGHCRARVRSVRVAQFLAAWQQTGD